MHPEVFYDKLKAAVEAENFPCRESDIRTYAAGVHDMLTRLKAKINDELIQTWAGNFIIGIDPEESEGLPEGKRGDRIDE